MSLAHRLFRLPSPHNFLSPDSTKHVREVAIVVSAVAMAAYFAFAAIDSLAQGQLLRMGILLGVVVAVAALMLMVARRGHQPAIHACAVLAGLALIYMQHTGAHHPPSGVALGLYPLLFVVLLGNRQWLCYTLGLWVLVGVGLFVPLPFSDASQTPVLVGVSLLLAMLLSTLLVCTLDTLYQQMLRSLEKQVLDQKSAYKLKEEFIANLSHQIRTPLNNIVVISTILENSEIDDKQRDMINTIHASTNNLVNVVNSMAEVSNVDIKERSAFSITFDLSSTLSNTISIFSSQNAAHTVFNLAVDESIPKTLSGDPVKIKQILLNLIESILKHKAGEGKTVITIRVRKSKENQEVVELHFEIKCNQPILLSLNGGHNLFVTHEHPYTGMGAQMYIDLLDMAISQKLVEDNGGKIGVSLNPESATLSFPYILRKEIAHPSPRLEPKGPRGGAMEAMESPAVELDQANVLLVEDNLINQKIVVLSLKKLVKSIEIANNGKEALDKFGTSRFDIILMDIQMPIMNGIVTTKKIREVEASTNTHTPIIAITANALLGDKEECLAAGMDDYISKPFQIEVLIQKMKLLLGSA